MSYTKPGHPHNLQAYLASCVWYNTNQSYHQRIHDGSILDRGHVSTLLNPALETIHQDTCPRTLAQHSKLEWYSKHQDLPPMLKSQINAYLSTGY